MTDPSTPPHIGALSDQMIAEIFDVAGKHLPMPEMAELSKEIRIGISAGALATHEVYDRHGALTGPAILDVPGLFHPVTFAAIQAEAVAAAAKHGTDNTPLGWKLTREEKLVVLVEEVGEVARALTYDQDDAGLVRELIQVATMAAMWAQSEDGAA